MSTHEEFLRQVGAAKQRIKEISSRETQALAASGAVLIDVRERKEFEAGHLGGALNIGLGSLARYIVVTVPNKSSAIVCYCAVGHRSALAADLLQSLGYRNVASLAGGLKGGRADSAMWAEAA